MFLQKLKLFSFKNYEDTQLEFGAGINVFLGRNGSGKTNLLDAIHYLSFTKSAINPSDVQNIQHGQGLFVIKGEFVMGEKRREVICSFQQGQKKTVKEDGQDYQKFSEHVGKYPVVMIAPQDIELIWDGSEQRRKFFDSVISQLDKTYLDDLITYTAYLKQRNSLLKLFSERGKVDKDLLAGYDQKIIPAGRSLFEKRKQFVEQFVPLFKKHYQFLSDDGREEVDMRYRSDLESADFAELLSKNLQKDVVLQRTSAGIHRDDFLFSINGNELKRFGSQGQQKSYLIGLKLAEFETMAGEKGFKPILLLDDIFDKLDDPRIHKLMLLVAQGTFGQIFITDARSERSLGILEEVGLESKIFHVHYGVIQ